MTPTPTDLEASARAAFGPLRRAETLLLRACASGGIARVGLRLPEQASNDVVIRAAFVVHLLRAGHALRGRRLQVTGAFIEGRLDLGGAAIPASLWFFRCGFDAPVLLDGARVAGSVTLSGCRIPSLLADDCSIANDLVLNAGTQVWHSVRLNRARIGGDLNCARLDLSGGGMGTQSRRVLLADRADVGGDVLLTEGFQAIGEVRFAAARVAGDLHASGHFNGSVLPDGGRGAALVMDRIAIGGSVLLDEGFGAAGRVTARRARIDGDFDASGASFDWLGEAAWGDGVSLVLDRARIEGTLALREQQVPLRGASFVGTCVGTLADDTSTWGDRLALDGFTYSRFDASAPMDTQFRIAWLERQQPAHLSSQFRPQPWRRLIRVLRRMGHEHDAGSVAVRREMWLRRVGRVGAWAPRGLRWAPQMAHAVMGLLTGYGHRPGRLVAWMTGVWLVCGTLYWAAGDAGADAAAVVSPFAYSLDRILPWIDLDLAAQGAAGATWPDALRWLSHLEAGFGLVAVLLLAASLAGWVDRDRQR